MATLYDITFENVLNHKKISNDELLYDITKLKNWEADKNAIKFCGNKFLYHFQIENLLSVKRPRHPLLKTILSDPEAKEKFINEVKKRKKTGSLACRIFETYRVNKGTVAFFKPATAKYIYKHYKATYVLDPTAGWGGRMLGAWALDIHYTGIDTNTTMKPAYDEMMTTLNSDKLKMIWESALTVDYTEIDYDFVLTSPPYINLELYDNMTPFKDDDEFYNDFLIPLIDKCRKHIKRNGKVAFNISPKMYQQLLGYGYESANETLDLPQQGAQKGDKIYVW